MEMTTLTMKEANRLEIIQRVYRGELTVVEAALIQGVRARHCYRIKERLSTTYTIAVGVKGNPAGLGEFSYDARERNLCP